MASDEEIARAAQILQNGGLVIFPTETVYGLGANALDENAVRGIFAAKQRPLSSPLIVHVSSLAMAQNVVASWPSLAQKLADKFWPGPLTLVLPKRSMVPSVVTAGLPSVGVRMPSHEVALKLISLTGLPIAAPSANRFKEISPTNYEHAFGSLGSRVEMILDGGPARVGIESTVVSLAGAQPLVLRPGSVSIGDLETVTGVAWQMAAPEEAAASPGQHIRHYAPQTPLYLVSTNTGLPNGSGLVIDMPREPREFATVLYARLHAADKQGLEWLAIVRPPDAPEWFAIHDRLRRASISS